MNMLEFGFTAEEEDLIRNWQKNHDCRYRTEGGGRYVDFVGSTDTYSFTPCTIGCIRVVRCACGAKLDLSNLD